MRRGPHSSTCRPLGPVAGRGAFTSPQSIQVTVQQPAESVAAAQPPEKGPAFPMTGRPLNSPDPPLLLPPCRKVLPHPLHQPVAPERTQASLSGPGSWGGHLATPGGPALEMGSWLQDSPPPPPCWPRALTPILCSSPSLPHCDRSAPPAISVPLPCSSGQGTWEKSAHPCSDPSLSPPQPAPLGT